MRHTTKGASLVPVLQFLEVARKAMRVSRFFNLFLTAKKKKIEHQTRGRRKINGKQYQEGEIEEQERQRSQH